MGKEEMSRPPVNGLLSIGVEPIQRTCRYGHGGLWRDMRSWSLTNFAPEGSPDPTGFKSGELRFICHVWVCRTCGYLELSDSRGD